MNSRQICCSLFLAACCLTAPNIGLAKAAAEDLDLNRAALAVHDRRMTILTAYRHVVTTGPPSPGTWRSLRTAHSLNSAFLKYAANALRVFDSQEVSQNVSPSGTTPNSLGGLCSASLRQEFVLILIVGVTYWLAMVVVRWNRVAQPSRELLRAQIAADLAELAMLPPPNAQSPADWKTPIEGLLQQASREMSPKQAGRGPASRLANFIFWSRGQELTSWSYIHSAEVQMAMYLRPENVIARLESVEQQLRISNDLRGLALANIIHQALTAKPPTDPVRLRELLGQALTRVYSYSDNIYADLISWQNKASWLVGCGLYVIFVLTIAIPHHGVVFVVGAAGGLVSRMSRSLNRKDVPTDYGASWTTLFLSPVAGALGAWTGILISALAAKLNILGPLFQANFSDPCRPETLAIALIFGFSERLLDAVLDKLEDKSGIVPPRNPQLPERTIPTTPPVEEAAGVTISTQTLPSGKIGLPYAAKLEASGAKGDVTWSESGGSLPPGLQLTLEGPTAPSISGTPRVADTFTFKLEVKDQATTHGKEFTIVIEASD